MRVLAAAAALPLVLLPAPARQGPTPFDRALARAERSIELGDLEGARHAIRRAQERDAKSPDAWALRARWAEAAGDRDELVYALHRRHALLVAQDAPRHERKELRARLEEVDPLARDLIGLAESFVEDLLSLAKRYEKEARPHSAIRVHREILAIDPERTASEEAIQRIASAPDPSLAEHAKPKDLLADVSDEWIAEFDAKHSTWKERATLEREHYRTHTNAGYAVLVRCAEAMEQMNAFYRQFFRYGTEDDARKVPRIDLNIFKTRDEYLELGIGPPVEWSGGHFTGNAVETYIDQGGFESTTGTLFHEAAHQFVSLATNAAGWLNEGLASFFEGCRILANGTVLMNMPANHRLFPLVERMERGWMTDSWDGMDPEKPSASEPERAPTFRIVLENEYPWGPAWYAPTWGVVYFLYNYQDPSDGRFVYRDAFMEYVDASGGRVGKGAVKKFEEVVLANPAPRTPGVELEGSLALPRTVEELDAVWKEWLVRLRDEQSGRIEVERPYHEWALHAITRGDHLDAVEHFEKGLVADPDDAELLVDFADLLANQLRNSDRAVRLLRDALRVIEARGEPDEERIDALERRLAKLDPGQKTFERVRGEVERAATSLVKRYIADGLDLMAMDLSWRLGTDLELPSMFRYFEEAARRSGKSLAIWKLAYDEQGLDGWNVLGNEAYEARNEVLVARFGEYEEDRYDYQFLTLDRVTSGDFSMEAEIQAARREVAFAGLVFGRKSSTDFHAAILYPPGVEDGEGRPGYVDLASFYGSGAFDVWRHNPVPAPEDPERSTTGRWHRLRIDVTGRLVDVWLDDEYVATQEFASLDVLRGSFGIVVGPGTARFRNIRYLARHRRDPGAAIEREIRLERIGGAGASRGHSWLGGVPPFPPVARWVQEPRTSWGERGAVPQLLVLWDVDQDAAIPLGEWLHDLAERYADVGLEIVAVANCWHDERVDEHLAEQPYPGSVGVDRVEGDAGLGETFETFFVDRFNLPRLLLLDVDQTVAWEGDPGFKIGVLWRPGDESYLDGPLEDLVVRRRLREVGAWRERWRRGRAAMAAGDVAAAAPALREARGFDWRLGEDVLDAHTRLAQIEAACASLPDSAEELAEMGAAPALDVLLEWAKALELPTGMTRRELRAVQKSESAEAWKRALTTLRPSLRRVEAGNDVELAERDRVVERLAELGGALCGHLATLLRAAGHDPTALREVVQGADDLPARWLAREHFGWSDE